MPAAECPIEGCTRGRGERQLLCRRHWYMVPRELRDRVWATARRMWAGVEGGDEEWQEARDAAIAAVEDRRVVS